MLKKTGLHQKTMQTDSTAAGSRWVCFRQK